MFDFPSSPATGTVVSGPNGAQWSWDGTKWRATVLVAPNAYIGDTPPSNPVAGTLWWCSTDGNLYTWFTDPNSSQWVIANSGGIPEAPTDGGVYARSNSAWSNITAASAAGPNNTGRNLAHNGLFNISQRTGPWTASGYTVDRWWLGLSGSNTASVTQQPLIDADRAQLGNEAAKYSLQINYTGTSGGSTSINQGIEDVRRLAGKTVTVSFWARANVAGRQLGVLFYQRFGTGGGQSPDIVIGSVAAVPITTSFQRYSLTVALPSLSGKTLGPNGDDHTMLQILFSDSSIGIQTAIASIWGVQLEYGSVATPLAVRDPADELALCQRFYSVSTAHALIYATTNQYWLVGPVVFPVTMRSYPTVVIGAVISPDANLGIGITADNVTPYGCRTFSSSATSGQANYSRYILASADL